MKKPTKKKRKIITIMLILLLNKWSCLTVTGVIHVLGKIVMIAVMSTYMMNLEIGDVNLGSSASPQRVSTIAALAPPSIPTVRHVHWMNVLIAKLDIG